MGKNKGDGKRFVSTDIKELRILGKDEELLKKIELRKEKKAASK